MTALIRKKEAGRAWETETDTSSATSGTWTSITLSSAQILALDMTSVEIVGAPGGRRYIVPILAIYHYRFGTTPYTGSANNIHLGPGTNAAEVNTNQWTGGTTGGPSFAKADFLAQTEDAYALIDYAYAGGFGSWLASEIEDKPFSLASGSAFADGDGTLTIRFLYTIIDGAP